MELSKAVARASGLDGVVVADTALSEVDGEQGRLVVAGQDIESLALSASFEDLCSLLWAQALPEAATSADVRAALAEGRARAFETIGSLGGALSMADGGAALMAAVAHVDPGHGSGGSTGSTWRDLALVTGAVATYAAAWARVSSGERPIAPDATLGHAADYLRMIRGEAAPEAAVRGLDTYLVTVADHGMNASTFTARVVASTGSDLVSSITAAIGALRGPLHGGAPGPVLDMLDAVGAPERAAAWVSGELDAGRRIMGMGHRIYRVRDPRAAVLEKAATRLEASGLSAAKLALARAVERAAEAELARRHPDRPLKANVEFYTAILLDAVGLPRSLFTPTFAVGRAAGWCAHVAEQRRTGRLIRPASKYVGGYAVGSSL